MLVSPGPKVTYFGRHTLHVGQNVYLSKWRKDALEMETVENSHQNSPEKSLRVCVCVCV